MVIASVVWRIFGGLIAAAVTLRYSAGILAWRAANALERPQYDVLEKLGTNAEIRRYAPYIVAEATIKARSMYRGGSAGFRACASYLFGSKNRDRALKVARPMAMTAPVRMVQGDDTVQVSFVMARNESLRTLPLPTDAAVKLRQVPGHTAAFIAFSGGRPSDTVVAKKLSALQMALARSNFRPSASKKQTLVYGYHDPFITPNFLRKNEVGFYVDPRTS